MFVMIFLIQTNLTFMKIVFYNIVLFAFFCLSSYGQNKGFTKPLEPIVFNSNVYSDFSADELEMLEEVYGASLESEILDRPSRILVVKEIFRNRVIVEQISDPKQQKPCPLLSEVPLFDAFVQQVHSDAAFDPSIFNPLKYDFQFHSAEIQRFRVDNTNYFITVKSQHYNTKL
jgi:hypothetical protein